jgi:hypothetical protein
MKAVFAVAFLFAALLTATPSPSQTGLPGPDAKLCQALPVADIEAALGAKVVSRIGSDRDNFYSCTANAGAAAAKFEWHRPGQAGLPKDVTTHLALMAATMGKDMKGWESKDFGEIGCYKSILAFDGQEAKTTACFLPKGYYTIGITKPGDAVPMETTKALLEKTAAAFKAP